MMIALMICHLILSFESLLGEPNEVEEFSEPISTDIQHRTKPFRSVGIRETILYVIDDDGNSIFAPDSTFFSNLSLTELETADTFTSEEISQPRADNDFTAPIDEFRIVDTLNQIIDISRRLIDNSGLTAVDPRVPSQENFPIIDRVGGSLALNIDCHRVPNLDSDISKSAKIDILDERSITAKSRIDRQSKFKKYRKNLRRFANFSFNRFRIRDLDFDVNDKIFGCGPGRRFNPLGFDIGNRKFKRLTRKKTTRETPRKVIPGGFNTNDFDTTASDQSITENSVIIEERIFFISDLIIKEQDTDLV